MTNVTLTREQWSALYDVLDTIRSVANRPAEIADALDLLGMKPAAVIIRETEDLISDWTIRLQHILTKADDAMPDASPSTPAAE